MKKLTLLLTSVFLSLIICFSFGCGSFVSDSITGGNSGGSGGSATGGATTDYSVILGESSSMTESVTIKSAEERAESPLSEKEARQKVARTSVALKTSGYGSGVIIDIDDGVDYGDKEDNIFYVVTCQHMVSMGGAITVYVADEDNNYDNDDYIFEGTIGGAVAENQAVSLIGGDAVSDVALLRLYIESDAIAATIEKAQILDTTKYSVELYESVFAIGNPTGTLPGSATSMGVANPLRKDVLCESAGYMTLMQIAVGTNPGNSGGGLYNLYGELIGITNAGNTNYESINFAIPLKTTENADEEDRGFVNVISQLLGTYMASNGKNYGYISGRWSLGVTVYYNAYDTRIGFQTVSEGSMAANAGALADDEIISIAFHDKVHDEDVIYSIAELVNSGMSASSGFNLLMNMIKSTLIEGENFTITVRRTSGRSSSQKDLNFVIANASYIFADTGVYAGITKAA